MKRIAESEMIINNDGSIFHLHLRPEELAQTILLVGDPDRVSLVGTFFDSIETDKQSREFHSITGYYKGKRISVISTGIGCDNIDIVMTELDALKNIDFGSRTIKENKTKLTILRLGTSGAIQKDIPLGSFVFSHYSIGFDGLLNWYAGRDEVSDLKIENAFMSHVKNWDRHLPIPYFVKASDQLIDAFSDSTVKGMTIAASGFYGPQCRVLRIPLAIPDLMDQLESFKYEDRRITNFEMEGSAIAGLAKKLGHEAGTVCCIIANRYIGESNADYRPYIHKLIELCLNKLSSL